MSDAGKPANPTAQSATDDEIYTPPDQSLFDFATKHDDLASERHRKEKVQLAHQQHVVALIGGIVVALIVVGIVVAIVINTLSK
jgi:hypothetical protein